MVVVAGERIEKLRKTSAEQALLRNIQALEFQLAEETDIDAKNALQMQILDLKQALSMVHGESYALIQEKNDALRTRVEELEKTVAAAMKEISNTRQGQTSISELEIPPYSNDGKLKLYELLLRKYSDLINEFEKKTVGEIKSMVDRENLTVQSLGQRFAGENYSFDRNYEAAVSRALEFISTEISYVKSDIDLNFWLTPNEILEKMVGDDEDIAVLLCSVLFALGDEKAEVVIAEMDNRTTHALVITEHKGKFFIFDATQKHKINEFSGDKAGVLSKYSFRGSRIKRFLYKFNRNNYEQFS
jgi:hypothetical protein